MMMDNERYKMEYNSVRETCLCKKEDKCSIKIEGIKSSIRIAFGMKHPELVLGDCIKDNYSTCPLFTMIKNVPGKMGMMGR